MSDNDEPEERRTEGVRIIGAQEAAEAAGRPDVVRRRRRSEKRYGDRPDAPEPASDLPKITISTTEGDGADLYGSPVPERDLVEPDPGYGAYDEAERAGYGHARLVAPDPDDPQLDPDGRDAAGDPAGAAEELVVGDPFGSAAPAGADAADGPEWDDPYEPPVWGDDTAATAGATEQPGAGWGGDAWGTDDAAPSWDEPFDDPAGRRDLAGGDDGAEDDDSFVLPHWTEPPTGQVPKVVTGDQPVEQDSLATYGSQPRWRDEGERTAVTDFDDLVDDGPRLGALANDELSDDFFSESDPYASDAFDERFDDGAEPVELGGEELGDDEVAAAAPRRAPQRRARREPAPSGGGDRHLGVAVAVGVALVAVGLVCFWLGALPTTLLATAVVTMAGLEYFTAVRERGNNPATLLGLVAIAGLMIAASTSGLAAYPVVIGLTVVFGLLWYLWVAPGERSVQNLGLTLLGVLWIGVLGSFATLFLGLGRVLEDASPDITTNPGIGVLIAAVIASVSHDVGAYFIGKYLGKTPLSAASPNKTQEGLVGGVLTSLVVTFVIIGLIGVSPVGDQLAQAFLFALLCAIVAPLGDLCESFIKRDLGIKDMGSVLPGHGGVLDRFDALLFVLPTAYFVTVLFGTWSATGA